MGNRSKKTDKTIIEDCGSMEERLFWLGFSVFPGIGPRRFQKLLAHFGNAKEAWRASRSDLRNVGLGESLAHAFERFKDGFSLAEYQKKLKELSVTFFVLTDPKYPKLLRSIQKPPFVLYIKGELVSDVPAVGVVGTRKITEYGREVTRFFTKVLVLNGVVIISGLALGVDAMAHETALVERGKTIAVLGCGVDCCYPRENQRLYERIIQSGGAVVSEVPLGLSPSRGLFPARNRIIAGLSDAVLVTEGAEDSGSLITAEHAFKEKRPVFAVPGPITSQLSKGPYQLIKKGARLATSAEEILEELKIQNANRKTTSQNSKRKEIEGETREEEAILRILDHEALSFDQIVRITKLTSSVIGATLSLLEIKGVVRRSEDGMFSTQEGLTHSTTSPNV